MQSSYFSFPQFDPVIFEIGPIGLRWYGLMYLLGFLFARWLAVKRANQTGSGWTTDQVDSLLFNGFMGVFLGGRIGYVLFYQFDYFLQSCVFIPCLGRRYVFPWRLNWCDFSHVNHG